MAARLESRFISRHVGTSADVLWEEAEPSAQGRRWSGLTGNYIRVFADTAPEVDLGNLVTNARLIRSVRGGMVGEVKGTPGR